MKEVFEKIIEQLQELAVQEDAPVYMGDRQVDSYIRCNEAIEVINRTSAEHNNSWIPVEDRQPDNGDYILISFENCSLPAIGRYEEDNEGGAFYPGDEDESCSSIGLIVNAWQPLPESYQLEEE